VRKIGQSQRSDGRKNLKGVRNVEKGLYISGGRCGSQSSLRIGGAILAESMLKKQGGMAAVNHSVKNYHKRNR